LPPPDNFPVFFAETEQVARRLGRVGDEFQDLFPVVRRGSGGVEIPVEVGLFDWGEGGVENFHSACFAESAPAVRREEAMVAGVTMFFQRVQPCFRFMLAVRYGAVDEQQMASGMEHAGGFTEETLR